MKKIISYILIYVLCISLCGCGGNGKQTEETALETDEQTTEEGTENTEETVSAEDADNGQEAAKLQILSEAAKEINALPVQVLDDKYRTFYEVFVYSYCDSDGDGIGDFSGLTSKLDYINDGNDTTNTDLGCNGIWLMPIMPSPTYHKYDVTDYYAIDPAYGTLDDFKQFITECDARGINVIIDMVLNHTSSEHPWFLDACKYLQENGELNETECPSLGYYNFTKEKISDCYYEVPGTEWYYEGRFWSGMPDLNLANENLRQELQNIAYYWLDMGVSGFRLDAVKEFYSDQTEANVAFLTWYNDMVKSHKEDAYLVGEAWVSISTYKQYYESGIDSFFNFRFADQDGLITSAVKGAMGENASTYGKVVASLEETFAPHNANYIDAPFYTNHDMGRSAGYYWGDYGMAQAKMSSALNLFMNGNAFLYDGEELGMKGHGIDENKRAPMQWSSDAEAEGMCDGPEAMEEMEMTYGSLETQQNDADSIYSYYKQVIHIRNAFPAIARGTVEFLADQSSEQICILRKTYEEKELLLIYNMSPE